MKGRKAKGAAAPAPEKDTPRTARKKARDALRGIEDAPSTSVDAIGPSRKRRTPAKEEAAPAAKQEKREWTGWSALICSGADICFSPYRTTQQEGQGDDISISTTSVAG